MHFGLKFQITTNNRLKSAITLKRIYHTNQKEMVINVSYYQVIFCKHFSVSTYVHKIIPQLEHVAD